MRFKNGYTERCRELVGVIAIYISCPGIYGQYAAVMQYKLPDEEIKSNPLSNCVEITRTGNQVGDAA